LEPIIPTQGIAMLYAMRGVGKTFLALSMACAIAGGNNLMRWRAPKARKVLYVDGEMSAQTMQDRLEGVMRGMIKPFSSINSENLRILNVTSQKDFSLDLAIKEDQNALENHLKGIDLLVIDNLSTLTSVKENEADSWLDVQQWLIKLRQRDVSTLLVHHAGKGGNQRGTSRKEDILDTVIAMKKSSDYTPEYGAQFNVMYEKFRSFSGGEAKPF
jgi:putative DNA primase/helicase